MASNSRTIGRGLALLTALLALQHASARSVLPITFGYGLGDPSADLLVDLTPEAAEPRPVYVELVKEPLSLPLVAEAVADSAGSAVTPAISASEKVEKVLRKPMAFSFNTDQVNAASDHIHHSPKIALNGQEAKRKLDQMDQLPAAVDYYKYLEKLQEDYKDIGAAIKHDRDELLNPENSEKKEVAQEGKKGLRQKSKPHISLSFSPSNFYQDYIKNPAVKFHKNQESKAEAKEEGKEEAKEEAKDDDHEDHAEIRHHHHDDEAETKGAASEAHEEQKAESNAESHADSQDSGSEAGKKEEEAQASASHHGGGGGGGGNYKKGGGKEFKQEHIGEHGEVGEKKYSGSHYHDKGEKGHKDKDDHLDEYEENIGQKKGHHDENGYESENHHGEEGKKGTQFHEEGEHSKGHSTKGEHNIHKKDEFEKKQEFYDESHEGGENEKHGEYFHEDDYNKGGHHKSSHEDGGAHEEHYGKQSEHEEGGHKHHDEGHKKAVGREVHHDHQEKEGQEAESHGGKKYHYHKGEGGGGGGDDNKGAHQTVQEVAKDGKAEASNNDDADDNKDVNFQVVQIISAKKINHGDRQVQSVEDAGDQGDEIHGEHSHEAYIHLGYDDDAEKNDAAADNAGASANHGLEAPQGAEPAQVRNLHNFEDANQPQLYVAETRPQQAEAPQQIYNAGPNPTRSAIYPSLYTAEARVQPAAEPINNYARDAIYGNLYGAQARLQQAQQQAIGYASNPVIQVIHPYGEHPQEPHVHPNGEICPGNQQQQQHSFAESAPVANIARPDPPVQPQPQAEESAPKSHVLVVGSDGNIYGFVPNGGAMFNSAA